MRGGWGGWPPVKGVARAEVDLVPIPDGDGEEFLAFCEHHGIHPLGSGRRGWWGEAGTYLRGATHLVYDGHGIDVWDSRDRHDRRRYGVLPGRGLTSRMIRAILGMWGMSPRREKERADEPV